VLKDAKSVCESVDQDMCIVVSALMMDKPVTQQTLIIKLLGEAIERLKVYNYPTQRSYELQRLCYTSHISVGSVLEEMLLNTENATDKQLQPMLKDCCREFFPYTRSDEIQDYYDFLQLQQTLTGTLLQSSSWTAHDIYLLLKIVTQCVRTCAEDHVKLNQLNKVLELIRANVVFPVSEVTRIRSDAKESVRYLMLMGLQEDFLNISTQFVGDKSLKTLISEMALDEKHEVFTPIDKQTLHKINDIIKKTQELQEKQTFESLRSHSHAFSEDVKIARNLALLILATKETCSSTGKISKDYTVHLPQQISYCLLVMKTKKCGRLLQVKSGEGKTCILSMVAATLALEGKKVDVLTTSPVLARRDCELNRLFYKKLGLTVTCTESDNNRGSCDYTSNIVYGTASSYARDILRSEFLFDDVRKGRPFDVLLVDEVDSMLIDRSVQSTYISQDEVITGFRHLEPILSLIYMQASQYDWIADQEPTAFHGPSMVFYKAIGDHIDLLLTEQTDEVIIAALHKCNHYLYSYMNVQNLEQEWLDFIISVISSIQKEIPEITFQCFILHSNNELRAAFGATNKATINIRLLLHDDGLASILLYEPELERSLTKQCTQQLENVETPTFLLRHVRMPVWVENAHQGACRT
jgi:hypothetical protein